MSYKMKHPPTTGGHYSDQAKAHPLHFDEHGNEVPGTATAAPAGLGTPGDGEYEGPYYNSDHYAEHSGEFSDAGHAQPGPKKG